MGTEALFIELRVVLGIDVGGRQHHIDVVGGECGCSFRPIVDNLKRNFESFLAVDRIRLGVEPAVCHQAADAPDPNVDTHPDLGIAAGRGCGYQQRLGGIHRLSATGGAFAANQLAEIYDSVSIQAVANQRHADQENKDPSTSLNFYGHTILLPVLSPVSSYTRRFYRPLRS